MAKEQTVAEIEAQKRHRKKKAAAQRATEKERQKAAAEKKRADESKAVDAQFSEIEGLEEVIAEVDAEQEKKQAPKIVDTPDLSRDVELTEEYRRAVLVTMDLFDQFIVYERDAPKEPRLMIWPAYTHIKNKAIDAAIVAKYSPGDDKLRVVFDQAEDLEDVKRIDDGIISAISILKKRTDGKFPTPGERSLTQLEYESLSALSYTQTVLFHMVSTDDILRGYIQISSIHAISVNHAEGTRLRQWVTVSMFAKLFIDVLSDESIEDKVQEIIDSQHGADTGYAQYLLRWREAELI